jgi:uncharacterized circularly permuted ATP-grasp superfamily protein/uncharacterized alpha-E superfamily protein
MKASPETSPEAGPESARPPAVPQTGPQITKEVAAVRGFASDYRATRQFPDEMVASDGSLRPYWEKFVSQLDEMGPEELGRRWDHARRLIHSNGVTHNIYGDPNGLERPWRLDLIPLLIPDEHWQPVSKGLVQRARLLDRLLADIYGPAETIFGGVLPPELVWANPGFLRSCHGMELPQDRWLHSYAADLVRAPDGKFQVLSDRTQAPSGAGYSLENRIVISRALPSVFRECRVQRLAPYFAALRESLGAMAPSNFENPVIVLLTPGPYNEAYFEHSYLARYLGYPLVQGNDLTVRDGNVYLKTLGGLQRVDVILRRVDDDFCDPLELFADSHLGVPGLLQAVRQGTVVVANAIGTGLLQAPGFLPFLPALCKHLLGEELLLPSVPTWWCGQPAELRYVLEHLDEIVVKSAYPTRGEDPVFGSALAKAQLEELAAKIKDRPERYVAQTQVMTCTTPALINRQIEPRRFVMRAYLTASGDSYVAMEGGLTRITQANESLVVSMQKGGGSKDTWILSEGPISQVTLLPPMGEPVALSRGGGDLPSRIADDLFWMGRCVERGEGQVRLARCIFARMIDQSGVNYSHTLRTLAAAWPGGLAFPEGGEKDRDFIEGVLGSESNGGLRGIITYVHSLARVLRDRISADAWRILQQIYRAATSFKIDARQPLAGLTELLDELTVAFAAFVGLVADSMTRGQAWTFLDMGRRIERVDFIGRLLRDTIVEPGADPVLLEAILEISDSSLTYRRRYLTHLEPHALADLLLADDTNPRSVAFQLARLDNRLSALPHDTTYPDRNRDQRLLLKVRTSVQLADLVKLCVVPPETRRDGLGALLDEVIDGNSRLSDAVARVYFSHAEVSRETGDMGDVGDIGREIT